MRHCVVRLILLAGLASPVEGQDLVLFNAQIVDPATRTVTPGAIWMENGRIAGRGPSAPPSARGQRIDLQGKFVFPGLIDLHTHSFGNAAPGNVSDAGGTESTAVRVLRAGVTALLDLFNQEDYVFRLRDRQRNGEVGGADIFAAGPCFTATRGHCSEYGTPTRLIDSAADVRRHMAALTPKRPDVIKVVYDHADYGPTTMPSIDRATLEALLTAARGQGFKSIVHVGTWEDVRHAALAGASAITHVPGGELPPDIGELLVRQGTAHIPTLAVHTDLAELSANPGLVDSPLFVALASERLRAAYRSADGWDARTKGWAQRQQGRKAEALTTVGKLHAAGVTILAGTDGGNWGIVQGYSVHREMLRLVEAGLPAWDALAASTTRAGTFLGRKYGVQAGDEGNLVVVEASPIENIENTQRITMVIQRGRVVSPR